MNRSTLKRLESLERQAPKETGRVHTFLVVSEEEAADKERALKASPEWREGDDLMIIHLVATEAGSHVG